MDALGMRATLHRPTRPYEREGEGVREHPGSVRSGSLQGWRNQQRLVLGGRWGVGRTTFRGACQPPETGDGTSRRRDAIERCGWTVSTSLREGRGTPTSDTARDGKRKAPQVRELAGLVPPLLAETEGFEPSIQVLAQMLP